MEFLTAPNSVDVDSLNEWCTQINRQLNDIERKLNYLYEVVKTLAQHPLAAPALGNLTKR